jgi:hypothetical protein
MKALNLFLLMLLLFDSLQEAALLKAVAPSPRRGGSLLSSRTTEANYVPSLLDLQMPMAPF